jgi:hypothetical protein
MTMRRPSGRPLFSAMRPTYLASLANPVGKALRLAGAVALLSALAGAFGCHQAGAACGAISTSDYDQSCSASSDCVLEPSGDFCQPNHCTNCIGGAINTNVQAQYEADLASKISAPALCPCPLTGPAVCDHGKCAIGALFPPADASSGN